jgi:glycosyltransferase involved in cell wall biosynthesis
MWVKRLMMSPDVWFKKVIPANIRHMISKPLEKRVIRKTKIPKPYEPGRYPDGINLYGLFKTEIGLAQGAKLYARALEKGNIPHTLLNLDFIPDLPQEDKTFDDRLTVENKYAINVVHINPPQWQDALGTFPQSHFDRHYNVGIFQWELETLPDDWKPLFDYVDEVWTPSEFTARTMRKETNKPVIPILYGMETPYDEKLTRADFGLNEDDFLVLMMFDSNSYASRKNPGAAIDAFREAYGENPEHVKLVIKINNPKAEDIAFVEEHIGGKAGYLLITERMDKERLNSLIRLCDVFLSLHRSEGFGLVMAEAMNLGTAAVATHWSANAEFMPEGTACNVSSRQIPVGDAYQDAPEGLTWADADVHEAAGYLRRLKEDPAYREEITRAGQAYIREELSTKKCAEKIKERMKQIIC